MNNKPTILHVIYNLGRGGAETMLVGVLKELNEYNNIVVTLSPINEFTNELECDQLICLNFPSLYHLPKAVLKLKKLVNEYKPTLVHSHLPLSNFIARLATPVKIPLITTIHTAISASIDYKKRYIRLLDRFTFFYRTSTIIAVSNQALQDYFTVLNIKKAVGTVIYTFVDGNRFINQDKKLRTANFKLVCIGSLRKNKNYDYLIEAFQGLKNTNITLDIYGQGPAYHDLQTSITNTGVHIELKGQVKNIPEILPQYDMFVMPSKYEGFSLSVLEAMAAKLPLFLSDIPSFKEQCDDCAIYFNLSDPKDFAVKLLDLMKDSSSLELLGNKGFNRMIHNFTLSHHVKKIKQLYEAEMSKSAGIKN